MLFSEETERKCKDKYLNFARELMTYWNMKVTVVPIINGAYRMVLKCFEKKK